MVKKLTLLAMTVAAVAAIAAPAASAAQLSGASVGDQISATSVNTEWRIPGAGTVACSKVVLNGVVETNSGGVVQVGSFGSGDTMQGCQKGGQAFILTPTFEGLELEGSEGEIALGVSMLTEGGPCPMVVTESSLSWVPGTDSLHLWAILSPAQEGCAGGELEGDYQLRNVSTNTPVVIN